MVIEKLKKAGFEDVSIQTFTVSSISVNLYVLQRILHMLKVATYEETGDASLTAKFDDDFTYNFIQVKQHS